MSDLDRDRLVIEHLWLARLLARRQLAPPSAREDILSAAYLGLVEAAGRWRRDDGTSFGTYAQFRIRGAITDHCRREDAVYRRTRSLLRRLATAEQRLSARDGHAPGESELAEAAGCSVSALRAARAEEDQAASSSLDDLTFEHADGTSRAVMDPFADPQAERDFERAEWTDLLSSGLASLTARERHVLRRLYWDGLTLREIAPGLGVTESRVCQIHAAALKKLRARVDMPAAA